MMKITILFYLILYIMNETFSSRISSVITAGRKSLFYGSSRQLFDNLESFQKKVHLIRESNFAVYKIRWRVENLDTKTCWMEGMFFFFFFERKTLPKWKSSSLKNTRRNRMARASIRRIRYPANAYG